MPQGAVYHAITWKVTCYLLSTRLHRRPVECRGRSLPRFAERRSSGEVRSRPAFDFAMDTSAREGQ